MPNGLSPEAKRLWKATVDTWTLDGPGFTLLQDACKSLDRRRAAEKLVREAGMTQVDRFGQIKAHPCMGIIRDEISSFVRLLKRNKSFVFSMLMLLSGEESDDQKWNKSKPLPRGECYAPIEPPPSSQPQKMMLAKGVCDLIGEKSPLHQLRPPATSPGQGV